MPISNLGVGKVAKRCGVKVSTLHFYEEIGLIESTRNEGNQRRYRSDVIRRVSIIKAAQKMGVSLGAIKQAFATLPNQRTPSQRDWQKLSLAWRDELNEHILQLERLRDLMTGCIGCGCLSMKNCPIYNPDDQLGKDAAGPVLLQKEFKSKKA